MRSTGGIKIMQGMRINGVRISGIASAVPANVRTIEDDKKTFGEEEAVKLSATTGVKKRYIPSKGQCTSDLCFDASEVLLSELNYPKNSIDALIFVSQTPDYFLPATSCILQHRLGLPKSCIAFDVNLGCSGYVYGLWIAASMIMSGNLGRVLFLAGDTARSEPPQDRATASLFGSAGTATLIEKTNDLDSNMIFSLGTDGSGKDNLIVPAGGCRYPRTSETSKRYLRKDNTFRSDEDLYLNGPEIFAFALKVVPPLVNDVLNTAQWSISDVDAFIFHQANGMMLDHLMKRIKIPNEKFISALSDYGNTSSASIPLAMTHDLKNKISGKESMKLLLAGFGVGYSWGSVAINGSADIYLPKIIISKQ